MKKMILLTILLSGMLYAATAYPLLYRGIGDTIYENTDGYKKLLKYNFFQNNHPALNNFIEKSDDLRDEGLMLDAASDAKAKKAYINKLRKLDKENSYIRGTLSRDLKELLNEREFELLRVLATLNMEEITNSKQVKIAQSQLEENADKILTSVDYESLDHEGMLKFYKEKLLIARIDESVEVACLNDITAINYWVLEVDRYSDDACKARDAIKQIDTFFKSSRNNCGNQNDLYLEFKKRTYDYRTSMANSLNRECQDDNEFGED